MKERVMWGGLVLICMSWAFNYVYFQSKQLEKPIFLEHYYETFIDEGAQLPFYYLTNKKNSEEVSHVVIEGLEGVDVMAVGGEFWGEDETNFIHEYSHYLLKSVTLEFSEEFAWDSKEASFTFENISVYFQNQTHIVEDVGKVTLNRLPENEGVFENRMSSSSNQHRSDSALLANEGLTIEEITVPWPDLKEEVEIKITLDQEKLRELDALTEEGNSPHWLDEGKEWEEVPGTLIDQGVFPLRFDKNDWLHLNMYFHPDRASFFQFPILIKGTTEAGKTFVDSIPIIDSPDLEQTVIDKMIAEKGGEK
ncbi:hypothetical protein [Mesobacillus foraminis]|uniref:Uncharacterized protein n=1 Tax=Mesobacillus foraminis TaxID=279826 RepID=A0A4R2B3V2_9BACI|nr:hypothetical protein [Mesobacillus foraminis]TCN20392.1 hypothetical protein EV146_1149 [Mesobacillus foraminis]